MGYEEDWLAIAPFHELSDLVWNLEKIYPDEAQVSITPGYSFNVKAQCNSNEKYIGDTLEWIEDLPLIVAYLYPFSIKVAWRNPLDKIIWRAEELVEAVELLAFDEDEFEIYHECHITGLDWYHMQSAALIARQNTVRKRAKYPALCGINVSAVNNNLELSAMCPTATTYRLVWNEEPFWENFSFTIPVELADQISQSIDPQRIDTVTFSVNPELIQAKVQYEGGCGINSAYFYVAPIQGRYFYPKVPINQITEKSVVVDKTLFKEALLAAIEGSGDVQYNQVLLQVQDEQLLVHGLASSLQIDAAECDSVPDSQIRVCAVKLLDMMKYIPDGTTLFLDFPDKITQALMLGTATGIQYLVFGLVKSDRALDTNPNSTEHLLTIPGITPGEPDLVLQLAEEPLLEPPLTEEEVVELKDWKRQAYGLNFSDWSYYVAIDETLESLLDARTILEECPASPEAEPLIQPLKKVLDDHEYAIAQYEAGDGDLYYHGGLCPKDMAVEVEAIQETTSSIQLLAGRVKAYTLKRERTYSVKMTFV
jgi:hypothetical protein